MSVKEYKCPCCGGNLVFNSDTQKLHCPSCDNEMDMETYQEYAKVVESTEQKKDTYDWGTTDFGRTGEWVVKEDGSRVYKCPSCGGEIEAGRRRLQPSAILRQPRSFFRNRYQGDLSRILSCRFNWMRKPQKKHIRDSAKRRPCFQDPSKATRRSRRSRESMSHSGCSAVRQREPSIIMDRGSKNGGPAV